MTGIESALRNDSAAEESPVDRTGTIGIWAVIGLGAVIIAVQAWARWILSDTEFVPAPILGPDGYPTWRLVILRITELLSVVEMAVLIYFVFILPKRRTGRFGIDAKITTGLLIGSVTDGFLNMHQYLFAWNAHSINMGSWAAFMPLASEGHPSRYAEALIWGIPQYTYYCITIAMVACAWIERKRRSSAAFTNAKAYAGVFAAAFVFDFTLENFLIRVDHAYAFAKTPSVVTLWAGSHYQFPIYESILVAGLGVAFTALRLGALDDPDGLLLPERGFQRLDPRLQTPARWLAVIGFCVVTLSVIYHLPFNWLGTNGDSFARIPSYLMHG